MHYYVPKSRQPKILNEASGNGISHKVVGPNIFEFSSTNPAKVRTLALVHNLRRV